MGVTAILVVGAVFLLACGAALLTPRLSLATLLKTGLAAVAIPVAFLMFRAMTPKPSLEELTRTRCINDLRQIDSAKEQWAIEKKVAAGLPVNEQEVNDYIKGGAPKCAANGTYIYGNVGTLPLCTLASHKLPSLDESRQPAPLVFVAIDAETERRLGEFPLDRKLTAQAIDKITQAGAKGILLKFFYDRPSNPESDGALERAICAGRVALQASLNSQEGTTNQLASRFELTGSPPPEALAGHAALLPLPALMSCAKEIGFVDFQDSSKAPLVEMYRGKLVKSLYLVGLEMAHNSKAILSNQIIVVGQRQFHFDSKGSVPVNLSKKPHFETIPFHELLSDSNTWKTKIQGSVVVVGYDGPKIHKIKTPDGELGAHRFFITSLAALR